MVPSVQVQAFRHAHVPVYTSDAVSAAVVDAMQHLDVDLAIQSARRASTDADAAAAALRADLPRAADRRLDFAAPRAGLATALRSLVLLQRNLDHVAGRIGDDAPRAVREFAQDVHVRSAKVGALANDGLMPSRHTHVGVVANAVHDLERAAAAAPRRARGSRAERERLAGDLAAVADQAGRAANELAEARGLLLRTASVTSVDDVWRLPNDQRTAELLVDLGVVPGIALDARSARSTHMDATVRAVLDYAGAPPDEGARWERVIASVRAMRSYFAQMPASAFDQTSTMGQSEWGTDLLRKVEVERRLLAALVPEAPLHDTFDRERGGENLARLRSGIEILEQVGRERIREVRSGDAQVAHPAAALERLAGWREAFVRRFGEEARTPPTAVAERFQHRAPLALAPHAGAVATRPSVVGDPRRLEAAEVVDAFGGLDELGRVERSLEGLGGMRATLDSLHRADRWWLEPLTVDEVGTARRGLERQLAEMRYLGVRAPREVPIPDVQQLRSDAAARTRTLAWIQEAEEHLAARRDALMGAEPYDWRSRASAVLVEAAS